MNKKDVVIIGAGPYGLSVAAHLRNAGIEPYVIGRPMAFWKENMPPGMFLRSRIEASNIDAPQKHLAIELFQKGLGRKLPEPLPIEDFIAYGEWLQAQIAPNVDTRLVRSVSRSGEGFKVTFEDGTILEGRCVVLALGIGQFRYVPEQFAGIPKDLAVHSAEFRAPADFKGLRVAVVGRGQSALEYAAILNEHQADVQILTRSEGITFLPFAWRKHLFRRITPGPLKRLSYLVLPPTDLGDIRTARKMADPNKFRRQSAEIQTALLKDVTTPRGAYWLPSRLDRVPIKTGVTIRRAEIRGRQVKLFLGDGSTQEVDRVLLATGYKIDVTKFTILDESLQRELATNDGYPTLDMGLESSVKGLFLAGVVAERTLGPTLRFVTGTSNAGPRVAKAIARRLR